MVHGVRVFSGLFEGSLGSVAVSLWVQLRSPVMHGRLVESINEDVLCFWCQDARHCVQNLCAFRVKRKSRWVTEPREAPGAGPRCPHSDPRAFLSRQMAASWPHGLFFHRLSPPDHVVSI